MKLHDIAIARSGDKGNRATLSVIALDPAHPIFRLDNAVLTNHIGWYSEEAMRDLQRKAAEEAVRVLRGEAPLHWLNRF